MVESTIGLFNIQYVLCQEDKKNTLIYFFKFYFIRIGTTHNPMESQLFFESAPIQQPVFNCGFTTKNIPITLFNITYLLFM